MDKKNTYIGALLLAVAALLYIYVQRHAPVVATSEEIQREAARSGTAGPGASAGQAGPGSSTSAASAFVPEGGQATFLTASTDHNGPAVGTLENSTIRVSFTDFGGAIKNVALKKYPATQLDSAPYLLNEVYAEPLLGFVGLPGLDQSTRYAVVSTSPSQIVFRTIYDGRIEVTRTYSVAADGAAGSDPYQIRQVTTLRNLTDKPTAPLRLSLSAGTAAPANLLDNGIQLMTGSYNGSDGVFVRRAQLEASGGFASLGAHEAKPYLATPGPVVWASVQNQFFASILTPDDPASGSVTRRVKLYPTMEDSDRRAYGVENSVTVDVPDLPAHGSTQIGATLYAGPKEYTRLANADLFKKNEDKIMNFGWYGICSPILLHIMVWMHSWTANWGVAIILTTLSLKFVFLPFTLTASRSAKRMQKIQPELKAVREKYKDNPAKQQSATLELFKKHKVNPAGGCLPMLVTMPFFFGFFRMLQSTAELRFAPFLWAHDLSAPDTVLTFGHGMIPVFGTINVNILPLILCVTVVLQMRITPQPTVDNSQMWMMKLMPFMFMFVCYNYSCALSLYSSVNGMFTIGQQMVINRTKDLPEAPAGAAAGGGSGGRPSRNVTPRKK